jgi:hypothetical protein
MQWSTRSFLALIGYFLRQLSVLRHPASASFQKPLEIGHGLCRKSRSYLEANFAGKASRLPLKHEDRASKLQKRQSTEPNIAAAERSIWLR